MKQNIMFIIFPGFNTTDKHFNINEIDRENKKFKYNSNFIPELKKLGKVHFVNSNWNNLPYYYKNQHIISKIFKDKKIYNKNIDCTLDDLNINNYCKKVYNDVKKFKGKFILIGHSIGSLFVYSFSQKYSSRCLFNFLLDGSGLSPNYLKSSIKYSYKEWKNTDYYKKFSIKNITNDTIQELIKKSKLNDDYSNFNLQYICILYLKHQIQSKNIKVKTISFRNLQIVTKLKKNIWKDSDFFRMENINEEEYFLKQNPNKYRTIYFVNKGHYPHWKEDSREIILNTIKSYLL